jgi:hypothetical protein
MFSRLMDACYARSGLELFCQYLVPAIVDSEQSGPLMQVREYTHIPVTPANSALQISSLSSKHNDRGFDSLHLVFPSSCSFVRAIRPPTVEPWLHAHCPLAGVRPPGLARHGVLRNSSGTKVRSGVLRYGSDLPHPWRNCF